MGKQLVVANQLHQEIRNVVFYIEIMRLGGFLEPLLDIALTQRAEYFSPLSEAIKRTDVK